MSLSPKQIPSWRGGPLQDFIRFSIRLILVSEIDYRGDRGDNDNEDIH